MQIYEDFRQFSVNASQLDIIYNPFSEFLWVYRRSYLYTLQDIEWHELDEYPEKYPIEINYKIDKNGCKSKYKINTDNDFYYHKLALRDIEKFEQFWIYLPRQKITTCMLDIEIRNNKIVKTYLYETKETNRWNYVDCIIPDIISLFIKKHLLNYDGFVEISFTDDLIIRNVMLKRGFSFFYPYKKIIYCKLYKAELMECDIIIKHQNDNCFVLFK